MIISPAFSSSSISFQASIFSDGQSFEFPSFKPGFDFQPVLKNGVENPPYTNRGGIYISRCSITGLYPIPPHFKCSAIIDYLSVVFPSSSIVKVLNPGNKYAVSQDQPTDVQDFMIMLEDYLPGLVCLDRHQGMFGYKTSFVLYRDDQQAGLLAYEGNGDGVYLSLSGVGCSGVDMYKLRLLFENLDNLKITRVDCAHDDLDGRYSIGFWYRAYKNGKFYKQGGRPTANFIDDLGSNKGKTLTVGKKENGKQACIYEKGKQKGDKSSPWVRVEGRLTNSDDKIIPLDVLSSPEAFLAVMYPCFIYLCDVFEPIQVIKNLAFISFDKMTHHLRMSYGKMINAMQSVGMSPDEIIQKILRDGIPKRLMLPCASDSHKISFEDWLRSSSAAF